MRYNGIMNTMQPILVIFILLSVVHITFIILKKEKLRYISKCLLMPLLLAVYITGGGSKFLIPIPALVLGWIGDVMLIKIQKKANFMLGLASFLLGHICYIAAFIAVLGIFGADGGACRMNLPAILIFTPPAIVLGFVVYRLIKPLREMRLPVILYMTVLELMTLFGFQVFLLNPGVAGLLILSGCICFMVSDTILAYYTFRKIKVSGSVLLMGYYILAQAEIILGLLMLL